ncbi:virion structural protein [Vibrio phage BONAISHI]|nr:virion structural protein [Vibrio phage BONAISHI]
MSIYDPNIKDISRSFGIGTPDSSLFNLWHGPNHNGTGDVIDGLRDHQGYTFFTKPNCNLTAANILSVRKLHYLLDTNPNSMASAVRNSLMPKRMGFHLGRHGGASYPETRSPAVNDRYPFIPMLSTTLESLSGWPDEVVEWFKSAEGVAKQVYGWADSYPNNYSSFPLTATFIAKDGDPHFALFTALREYMLNAAIGQINPWPESEAEFEIDYMMNIYTLKTDPTKRYLRKIACLGGGGALGGLPTGASFNFSAESIFSQENSRYVVPFECFGVRYNDPIIIDNFNDLVWWFNPSMRNVVFRDSLNPAIENYPVEVTDQTTLKIGEMVQIPFNIKEWFQWRGYPYINPRTSEIEWWIERSVFDAYIQTIGG